MNHNDVELPIDNMNEIKMTPYESICSELNLINDELSKYIDNVNELWNNVILKSIDTNDFYILQKLENHDKKHFVKLMCNQSTYKKLLHTKQTLLTLKNNYDQF